ncbi:DUF6124 family protein [Pseudomonas sp. MDT1-17]
MFKPLPEKLESIPRSPYVTLDPKKLHAAAKKALKHHLKQNNTQNRFTDERTTEERAMKMFAVAPDANPEELLIQTFETYSSVGILLLDLAEGLEDKDRHLAMAIYQLSELGLLLVEKTLNNERAIATA